MRVVGSWGGRREGKAEDFSPKRVRLPCCREMGGRVVFPSRTVKKEKSPDEEKLFPLLARKKEEDLIKQKRGGKKLLRVKAEDDGFDLIGGEGGPSFSFKRKGRGRKRGGTPPGELLEGREHLPLKEKPTVATII